MFNCKKCGTFMVEDSKLTASYYDIETTTLVDSEGAINYEDLPRYIIFSCRRCGETRRITIDEMITSVQGKIVKLVLHNRLQTVYSSADKAIVDEASGVAYCGVCLGVIDNSGTCYNDVISQCIVRKSKLDDI